MLFLDFCASLTYPANSSLLSEIHASLLKAILRDEEQAGAQYSPLDVKDSVNLTFHLLDAFTLPELLRQYLASEPIEVQPGAEKLTSAYSEAHGVLERCTAYPYDADAKDRLKVLRCLADIFLLTAGARTELYYATLEVRRTVYDDQCRACNRGGDLLCCESCTAVYHLDCLDPPLLDVPTEEWHCAVCVRNNVQGVADCLTPAEKSGVLVRHEPLGCDRFGRRYWFLARRIIVERCLFRCNCCPEDAFATVYYSTVAQVELLLDLLDSNHEASLHRMLKETFGEISRQMTVTEELTKTSMPPSSCSLLELESAIANRQAAQLARARTNGLLEALFLNGWLPDLRGEISGTSLFCPAKLAFSPYHSRSH